ncbi:hypothetical protein [Burkholderia cenocepacia]|jgi:hypothetical protein|uniref:Uncharacterized protein n=1 Tax=Burkholderia cenocepacia (strain ATCC BAA-245 / DSM 16553 / LMG 16656 / NCTC 13227 / J2315 / CF5610) TaxID=216591 RepID=B4EB63_BURCJ|nr:hypothetical protein [Burkholderia cenocepacia]KIS48853.1 hypothetical protein NP88_6975 [Burkholderia cepacia]EPZ85390.1 hypothetical protein BURCENK562V_C5931 [Burkholderia cenocepacia K56-2Valvano]ERI31652.1 hypothetical protein BURCENBC7_AP5868 [Burkholderia cenocepacia BC7]KKI79943.1 hypothetical protein WQ49_35165 [Burkholderia cenocepacia]ONR55562.1 hypothetical protein A8E17_23945 [Burkholderia cenocepacia]
MRADENPRRPVGCEYGAELMLAWGRRVSAAEVRNMRGELFDLIHELAEVEGWADERRDRVLYPALCGSLGDLLPDLHHFRQRVADTRAATAARNVAEIVESGLLLTKAPRHP